MDKTVSVDHYLLYYQASSLSPRQSSVSWPEFVDSVAFWPEIGELLRVAKLAGEKSWLVFHQMKMSGQDMMWLNEEVENWTRTRGYNRFSPYVTGTTVINDPGERALGVMRVTNKINSLKMGQVLELNTTSDYFNFSILPGCTLSPTFGH